MLIMGVQKSRSSFSKKKKKLKKIYNIKINKIFIKKKIIFESKFF